MESQWPLLDHLQKRKVRHEPTIVGPEKYNNRREEISAGKGHRCKETGRGGNYNYNRELFNTFIYLKDAAPPSRDQTEPHIQV